MKVHITNWTIPPPDEGEYSMNIHPPGRVVGASIDHDQAGTKWLRLVTVEDED